MALQSGYPVACFTEIQVSRNEERDAGKKANARKMLKIC